ncbi:MAG: TRAP transporter fused permease subunit [Pseudomonadota bacterium]|nr:TRAP transporter fused permease subunit [Pseudomonadota bacterium]
MSEIDLSDRLKGPHPFVWVTILAAIAMCLIGFYTSYFGSFQTIVQTSSHLLLVLVFLFARDTFFATSTVAKVVSILFLIGSIVVYSYQIVFFEAVTMRQGRLTDAEFWLGLVAVVILLEAARRTVGWSLVIIAGLFFLYPLVGNAIPGLLQHRGYSLERLISHVFLGGEGIFGTPLGVSATFIIAIVLYGAVLEASGAGKVLMDVAVALTGRSRGGPAKAAVIGSGLMGMISGSAVANVLTTGTVSIPLMRRVGYPKDKAAAIEAAASTGAQIMPPVMGAAAFLMADMMGVSYLEVTVAALVPAILYFVAIFISIHLEAVKLDIKPMRKEELPSLVKVLREGGHLLLSLPLFIGMLVSGYSVTYATAIATIAAVLLTFVRRSTWFTPASIKKLFVGAAHAVSIVAVACATAGIVIGAVSLTGLGLKFSALVVTLAGDTLWIGLVLSMIAAIVLGMGLPTAAAYILVATLVTPALAQIGADLIGAHFFVFYFAILSAITPPVAIAAFSAASLLSANPLMVAVRSVGYGISGFIVPFFFVYNSDLLLLTDDTLSIVVSVIGALVGISAITAAIQGYAIGRLGLVSRALLVLGALFLINGDVLLDLIGAVMLVGSQLPFVRALARPQALRPSGSATAAGE